VPPGSSKKRSLVKMEMSDDEEDEVQEIKSPLHSQMTKRETPEAPGSSSGSPKKRRLTKAEMSDEEEVHEIKSPGPSKKAKLETPAKPTSSGSSTTKVRSSLFFSSLCLDSNSMLQ